MSPKRNWSSLLLSNLLLTMLVTLSAGVLGYFVSDLLNCFLNIGVNRNLFPEFLQREANVRGVCVGASIPAGFLIAQICFVLQVLRPGEFAAARFFRFRLITAVFLTCAAAALLYVNVAPTEVFNETSVTRVRYGWPFPYSTITTWVASPAESYNTYANLIPNAIFCLDLLFILLVVLEFLLARRDSARTASTLPASESTLNATPQSI